MKKCAMIVEVPTVKNGFRWKVQAEGATWPDDVTGPGQPPADAKVGDKGTIEYRVGRGYGLYFWQSA